MSSMNFVQYANTCIQHNSSFGASRTVTLLLLVKVSGCHGMCAGCNTLNTGETGSGGLMCRIAGGGTVNLFHMDIALGWNAYL